MTRVLVTGGAGFLGARLARELLARETVSLAGAAPSRIDRIVLTDLVAPPPDLAADPRVQVATGSLQALLARDALPLAGCDAVFHLAAAVSGECEADLDLGLRSNLDTTLALLQACRAAGQRPLFVFASSVAVFGQGPGLPLPARIEDDTLPTPQGSYGVQKFIGEQLVADFSRRGLVRGRSVRLMTVSVRPGRPNGAASGFLSGIVREPLAGVRAVCPVAPDTEVALASPRRAIEGLLVAAEADNARWGPPVALNLPALTTTPAAMAEALGRIAGPEVAALIDWQRDAAVERLVGSWPSRIHARRAAGLGLVADDSVDDMIQAYLQDRRA